MHAIANAPNNATASSAVRVAVDLAKDVFELACADASGRTVERKRLSRAAFARAFDNRPRLRDLPPAAIPPVTGKVRG